MEEKIKKIKVWFESLTKGEISYDKGGIKPTRDWQINIVVTFVVLVILGLVAGYFYAQVNSGKLFTVSSEVTQNETKLNRSLFDKVVEDINNRKNIFDQANLGKDIPQDPAI